MKYGIAEGLQERLLIWASRVGRDRDLPWLGTGLVADLKIAAKILDTIQTTEYDL